MDYLVCVARKDDVFWGIESFDGDLKSATSFFLRRTFYHGDTDDVDPLDYCKDTSDDLLSVMVVPVEEISYGDIVTLTDNHKRAHEEEESQIEASEKKEYERLREKYEKKSLLQA